MQMVGGWGASDCTADLACAAWQRRLPLRVSEFGCRSMLTMPAVELGIQRFGYRTCRVETNTCDLDAAEFGSGYSRYVWEFRIQNSNAAERLWAAQAFGIQDTAETFGNSEFGIRMPQRDFGPHRPSEFRIWMQLVSKCC